MLKDWVRCYSICLLNQHFLPFLYPQSNFSSSPSIWKFWLRFYLAFSVRIDKSRRLLTLLLFCFISGFKLPRSCHFPRTALSLSSSVLPKCYWASPRTDDNRPPLQCFADSENRLLCSFVYDLMKATQSVYLCYEG